MNEGLFPRLDRANDPLVLAKEYFNLVHMMNGFFDALSNLTHRIGYSIGEGHCSFPDLDDPDPDFHFEGVRLGILDEEIVIGEQTFSRLLDTACDRYLELRPTAADVVRQTLAARRI